LPEPDGAQVARVIQEMMRQPEQLRQMGENGRLAFLQQYTLSHAIERYSRLLEETFGYLGKAAEQLTALPPTLAVCEPASPNAKSPRSANKARPS